MKMTTSSEERVDVSISTVNYGQTKTFFPRTVVQWNQLQAHTCLSESLDSFKTEVLKTQHSRLNCVSLLTGQQHFNVNDTEETKNSIEGALQKFLELSKETEAFFLRKKMLVSFQKPEQLLNDDIGDLKAELARKEQLLDRHAERLKHCQSILQNTAAPAQSVQQQSQSQPAQPQSQTTQQQTPMSGQHPPPPSQTGGQYPNMGTPPMPQYSPHHIQQPPTQQSQVGVSGMGSYQGYNTPPGHGPPTGMQQQHPMGGMGPRGQGPPSYPQGPLAFLEQTTSNIGLPDRR